MRTPLFVLVFLISGAVLPCRADEPQPVAPPAPPAPSVLVLPTTVIQPARPTRSVIPVSVMVDRLRDAGWRVFVDGHFERIDGRLPHIPHELIEFTQLVWKDGVLCYKGSFTPVEDDKVGPILEGLTVFASAMREDVAAVGRVLAAWGIPQVYDGRRLIEPDGTASYFGLMLHQVYQSNPGALARLGGERFSQALDLYESAYAQVAVHQSPDIAQADIARAAALLTGNVRVGETTLHLRPYAEPGAALAGYRAQLEREVAAATAAGDTGVRHREATASLAALNALERQRETLSLPEVPSPGTPPVTESPQPSPAGESALAPPPALMRALPTVLRVLDRINGTPLTTEQQETLIKSFPMGETVWRLGVQELWRQGLTGRGVRVAVVDTGIAPHPELDGAVVSRENFTRQRGGGTAGRHGTHVAGVIATIAPEAEIRSYVALAGGNPRQDEPQNDSQIIAAITAAVRDGNRIINLSLGGRGHPSTEFTRVVNEFTARGVVFVVAAGNDGDGAGGVGEPATARDVIRVANLDVTGNMALSSSRGVNWDPVRRAFAPLPLVAAPGTNIYSTVPGGYETLSGTSMATPSVAGVSALLWQEVNRGVGLDPVTAAGRVRDAISRGQAMALNRLPQGYQLDQPVIVVDPLAAYNAAVAAGSVGAR